MSRIGKAPIAVPGGVDINIADGAVTVKGPKGTLSRTIPGAITVRRDEATLVVERPDDARENRALHGLTRTLVSNMVVGVTDGFTKELEIIGVGYRAEAQGPAGRYLHDLALISLARAYYSSNHYLDEPCAPTIDANRVSAAVKYWNRISPESPLWADALFESSWGYFMAGDYPHALGNLHN